MNTGSACDSAAEPPALIQTFVAQAPLQLSMYAFRTGVAGKRYLCSKVCEGIVKQALQTAGLVKKHRARGRHRLRREPRACFWEMLHLDGSVHAWFTLAPEVRPCLIAVSGDATKRVLQAAFYPSESTR